MLIMHFIFLSKKRSRALKFANFNALAKIKGVDIISKNISILLLSIIVVVLVTFALSGMTIYPWVETSFFSFVIAIDSSRSMEAKDLFPSRFEVAKETAATFIDNAPVGTKFGVISFAGNAYIESELTEEKSFTKNAIRDIPLSYIGGTDLYDAIVASVNLLEKENAKSMILISDGQINIGGITEAIEYAQKRGVMIHTIGVGTREGGQTTYGISKIDEDSLKAISYSTGGIYFPVENKKQMEEAFEKILTVRKRQISLNLSPYLLIASLILIFIEYILFNTRYSILP